LVRQLQNEVGPDGCVISLGSRDVDLTDNNATFAFFEKLGKERTFDHIFHMAALYKAGDWPVHHPATQFYANMSMNVNFFESWARYIPEAKLTSVLSYCMYPPTEEPHQESELRNTEPEDYLFAYAETKKALLIAQRAYRQEYNLSNTAVILPTVFGPGDSFAENSHVLGALIGKFVRGQCDALPEVEVWGDGTQEREFLFVGDAVDGIIAAARHAHFDVANLGTGEAYSIRSIVSHIIECTGYRGEVVNNTSKFVGVKKRMLDVTRIKKELNWTAQTSIAEGIQKTVDWYRAILDQGNDET
jgi:GDP-L-fucose synthase